jgi:hypothetical protein
MKLRNFFVLALIFALPLLAVSAYADTLGSANSYAVLATTAVTDGSINATTATVINGFSAASPTMGAVSCTGFVAGTGCTLGYGVVNGTTNLNNAAYTGALADSNAAYLALQNTTATGTFTCLGAGVGCLNNVAPGVYSSTLSSTGLNGTLTLAGGGDPNALWIFQFAAGLTTGTGSSVAVTGTGAGAGVYFQVGTQATLGQDSVLQGNFLAGTEIAFAPGAQINCGRAFTDTAAGTLVSFAGASSTPQVNQVSVDSCTNGSTSGLNGGTITTGPGGGTMVVATPEPGTFAFLSSGLALGLLMFRKLR